MTQKKYSVESFAELGDDLLVKVLRRPNGMRYVVVSHKPWAFEFVAVAAEEEWIKPINDPFLFGEQ